MCKQKNNLQNIILMMAVGFTFLVAAPVMSQETNIVNIIDTTLYSPDPSGLTFCSETGTLWLVDSEADEDPFLSEFNLFQLNPAGDVLARYGITDITNEPTGIAWNRDSRTLFITDDDQDKLFEVDPYEPEILISEYSLIFDIESDGQSFSADSEGITYNPYTGHLFIAEGNSNQSSSPNTIFIVDPYTGTLLDSLPSPINNPEGIYFDARSGHYFIVRGTKKITEVAPSGEIVNVIDLTDFDIPDVDNINLKGITFAPSSDPNDFPCNYNLFVADYGIDQVNDGRIIEISLHPPIPTLEDILRFFDESVRKGTLYGTGKKAWVAKFRLWLMRAKLKAADNFIERKKFFIARRILKWAYLRCDDERIPRDLVAGEAKTELADMIADIKSGLKCKISRARLKWSLVEDFVTRFYHQCLDRDPENAGLESWTNTLLNKARSGADVARGFIYSREFKAKNKSNGEFLNVLYKAFFNRKPDAIGLNTWRAQLDKGKDRGEVLNGFLYSQEFAKLCQDYGINPY